MGVGTLACVVAAACGSFSADEPEAPPGDGDGGGAPDAGGTGDGDTRADTASDLDAQEPTDAADDGTPVTSPLCFDLTAGTQGFTPVTSGSNVGTASAGGIGLTVNYGGSSTASFAAWQRFVGAPGASTGARVSVDLALTLPPSLPTSVDWQSSLLGVVNGTPANSGSRPFVQLVLGNGGTDTKASLYIVRFPTGTAVSPLGSPFLLATFDTLPDAGSQAITLIVDVIWSSGPGLNVTAGLSDTAPLIGPQGATLTGAQSPLLGLVLGGAARNAGAQITYKKVCYAFH